MTTEYNTIKSTVMFLYNLFMQYKLRTQSAFLVRGRPSIGLADEHVKSSRKLLCALHQMLSILGCVNLRQSHGDDCSVPSF